MHSRNARRVSAVAAVVVALFVVAFASVAHGTGPQSRRAASPQHATIERDAASAPAVSATTATARRMFTSESPLGRLIAARSASFALLCWIAFALSCWALLTSAGLIRRGRAPPFARA